MADHCKALAKRLSFPPEQDWSIRNIVSTSGKGINYKLSGVSEYTAIWKLDGNLNLPGRICDKVVCVSTSKSSTDIFRAIYVEFKGGDLNHAITQLENVLRNLPAASKDKEYIYARIVSSRGRRGVGNAIFEAARVQFKKKYNCELRAVKSGNIERL